MPRVVALVVSMVQRARISEALRGTASVQFRDRAYKLLGAPVDAQVDMVITQLCDRAGISTIPAIAALRQRFPSLPILAYVGLTPQEVRGLVAATRAGVNSAIVEGVDDAVGVLGARLTAAGSGQTSELIMDAVRPLVPPSVWPFFRCCAIHGVRPIDVTDAAKTLGIDRKTIRNRLVRAGLPPPRSVIAWNRLLHAARLLDDPGRRVEHVATILEFPSASAFDNMLRRYAALTPGELRTRGAFAWLLDTYIAALRGD